MKRSRRLALILMGHAPLLLNACSDAEPEEQQGFYTTVEACKADWNNPADCDKAAADAAKANEANGRTFTTRESCYAQFGDNCREHRSDSGSTWMPLMEGFLIGRILSPGGGWHSSYYPVYRNSTGTYTGFSSGGASTVRSGSTGSSFASVHSSANHSSTSRGGFGSHASSHGSSSSS